MTLAVETFLDLKSSRRVKNIFRTLAEETSATYMKNTKSRPHISLAVQDDKDKEKLNILLKKFCKNNRVIEIDFYGLGIFTNEAPVVWLAPYPTQELLRFHNQFHKLLGKLSKSGWSYYWPNRWVPHCTLATKIQTKDIPKIVKVSERFNLRFSAKIETLGLVDLTSRTQFSEFSLKPER